MTLPYVLCNVFVELQGFCDAFIITYEICLYLNLTDSLGVTSVHILCAKSRVVSLKSTTLFRLELCGVLLLVSTL